MVFSSVIFLVYFLPIVLAIYTFLPIFLKNQFLLFASLFFYLWGEPIVGMILIASSILNFYGVKWMDKSNLVKRKKILIGIITFNLLLLVFYKYLNFLLENLNSLFAVLNFNPINWSNILLPIGISFLTFQSITYIVDVYRQESKVQEKVYNFMLYIFLFPQLIAGPIVKYKQLANQITERKENNALFLAGFIRFSIGLAKKVLIANVLGEYAANLLDTDTSSTLLTWLGMFAYSLQIYFDFSGYSDMAIGLGQLFGFQFPENFNRPYTASSITEFWQRWHITLSDFMKNYLYIPLGGNRVSKLKIYRNLMIVFFLSGLWHGDNWTFIVWGLFHGFCILLERIFLLKLLQKIKIIAIPYTFLLVLIAWVFFRSENLDTAFHLLATMFDFSNFEWTEINNSSYYTIHLLLASGIILAGLSKQLRNFSDQFISTSLGNMKITLNLFLAVILFVLSLASVVSTDFNPFIYFKF